MVEIKRFTIIQIAFGVIQFGLFLAVLLVEILVIDSDKINRWITVIVMLILSTVIMLSACIKKLREWMPLFGRGYKVGITVLVAGALVFGETLIEVRSILAYVIVGVSVGYIILSGMFDKKEDSYSFVTFNQPATNEGNTGERTSIANSNSLPPAPLQP